VVTNLKHCFAIVGGVALSPSKRAVVSPEDPPRVASVFRAHTLREDLANREIVLWLTLWDLAIAAKVSPVSREQELPVFDGWSARASVHNGPLAARLPRD
jgi:hypothetical protein